MVIIKMNFSDLESVVKLYRDANLFANIEDIRKWTLEGLKKHPDYNLVYKQNGKIIAAISAVMKKDAIEINDIAVLRSARNKKIGTNLMYYFLKKITKSKVSKIVLWVHWKNTSAIPFYYKFGFQIKKCLKTKGISGVPDGEDIIYLEKII
ncbi:MAG: GNAT family N-acetyltransferase [Candidatus Pacearchaeota archaeon]